jgi:hypothetical protein
MHADGEWRESERETAIKYQYSGQSINHQLQSNRNERASERERGKKNGQHASFIDF